MEWTDRSVLEAVSWRLASELMRRHPDITRLIRGHPGGGQSDCLWILPTASDKGDVRLNRNGTIQVLERFDGRPANTWEPTDWDSYIRADPHDFLHRLEAAAGLPRPHQLPAATPTTLTYRVLAALAATAIKSVHPIEIQPGIIDTAGYGGGPNREGFAAFPHIPDDLRVERDDDFYGHVGYRFWFVMRGGEPLLAFEQRLGLAWTTRNEVTWDVMDVYVESRRHLLVTALKLLRRADRV